jgi:hypothetical protein
LLWYNARTGTFSFASWRNKCCPKKPLAPVTRTILLIEFDNGELKIMVSVIKNALQ